MQAQISCKPQHGYFMLRNPTQEELDAHSTREATDAKEAQVFEADPFRDLLANLEPRLGLENLVGNLSSLLLDRLRHSLPRLKAKAKARLQKVENDLDNLPEQVTEGQVPELLRKLVDELSTSINQSINNLGTGGSGDGKMGNLGVDLNTIFAQFQKDVLPLFILRTGEGGEHVVPVIAQYGWDQFDAEEDEEDEDRDVKMVTMTEVEDIIRKHKGLELPVNLPYAAILAVNSKFNSSWESDADKSLDQVEQLLFRRLQDALSEVFKDYPRLRPVMWECAASATQDTVSGCRHKLKEAVRAEMNMNPYTVLEHDFLQHFHSIHDGIKKQLAELRSPNLVALDTQARQERWAQVLQSFPELAGITSGMTADQAIGRLLTLQGDEDWAVTVMATSMAYFIAASRRICENVQMTIRTALVALSADFKQDLERRLTAFAKGGAADNGDVGSLDGAACYSHPHVIRLVIDDPTWMSNNKKRDSLNQRATKLENVLRTLQVLS